MWLCSLVACKRLWNYCALRCVIKIIFNLFYLCLDLPLKMWGKAGKCMLCYFSSPFGINRNKTFDRSIYMHFLVVKEIKFFSKCVRSRGHPRREKSIKTMTTLISQVEVDEMDQNITLFTIGWELPKEEVCQEAVDTWVLNIKSY